MVKDVAEWLRGLELEQYAPALRDNDATAILIYLLKPAEWAKLLRNHP